MALYLTTFAPNKHYQGNLVYSAILLNNQFKKYLYTLSLYLYIPIYFIFILYLNQFVWIVGSRGEGWESGEGADEDEREDAGVQAPGTGLEQLNQGTETPFYFYN